MKYRFSYILSVCILVITIHSCKKYEEGPGFTLTSAKARAVNDWSFSSVIENDEDVTSDYVGAVLEISKEGTCTFSRYNVTNNVKTYVQEVGTWDFANKKDRLELLLQGSTGSYRLNFDILKLKSTEMHLRSDDMRKDWVLVSNSRR